jgi:hypothetical protein
MTEKEFHFELWIQQGEERISEIDAKIAESQKILDRQKEIIEEYEVEKMNILKALGRYEEPQKSDTRQKGKVMIRPLLLQAFLESEGEGLTEQFLIDYVQQEKPTALTDSIRKSIQRLVNTTKSIQKHTTTDQNGATCDMWSYVKVVE